MSIMAPIAHQIISGRRDPSILGSGGVIYIWPVKPFEYRISAMGGTLQRPVATDLVLLTRLTESKNGNCVGVDGDNVTYHALMTGCNITLKSDPNKGQCVCVSCVSVIVHYSRLDYECHLVEYEWATQAVVSSPCKREAVMPTVCLDTA